MESLALQASNLNLQAGRGKGFKGRQCDYCKMKGHTRDNCYKLSGYPPRKPYGGGNENSEGWRRNTGNSDSWRREQSSGPAVNCVNGASSSNDTGKGYPERQAQFYSPFSNEQCRQILGLLNKETGGHHANMTATHHFIANKKFLQDSIDIDVSKKEQVHLPTGEKAEITHTGNASLFGQNLVQGNLYSGKVKGIGREQGGLYLIVADTNKSLINNELKTAHLSSKDEDYDLWHKRLGHPSSTVMQRFQNYISVLAQ
ncbi:hypothetical protein KY284_013737 [Solanum tuberosum]|nr:hypothetical protein KY284_013737 [Solanum tuberosum]